MAAVSLLAGMLSFNAEADGAALGAAPAAGDPAPCVAVLVYHRFADAADDR